MNTITQRLATELAEIKSAGLYKDGRIIESQQSAKIMVNDENVLNFCANKKKKSGLRSFKPYNVCCARCAHLLHQLHQR